MKKIVLNKYLLLIIGFSILYLLQFNSNVFYFNNYNYNSFAFNKALNQKEKTARNILLGFQDKENIDSNNLFKDIKKYESFYKNEGIAFYIFKNNKVIFWSNNNIDFSTNLKEFKNETGFVTLKNGWYQYVKIKNENKVYLSLILVKTNYVLNNHLLKNQFQNKFHISNNYKISFEGKHPIKSINGKILFYLEKANPINYNSQTNWIIIFSFIIAILLLFTSWFKILRGFSFSRNYAGFILVGVIILLRIIFTDFQYPISFFNQAIFSPSIYAHSNILPSLGFLLITALLYSCLVFYFSKSIQVIKKYKKTFSVLILIYISVSPLILATWIKGLIINSKLNFDINYLLDLNAYSIVGIVSIIVLFVSHIIFIKTCFNYFKSSFKEGQFYTIAWILALFAIIIGHFIFSITFFMTSWLLAIVISSAVFKPSKNNFYNSIIISLIISITISYGFIDYSKAKDNLSREFLANRAAKEKDPVAEYLFKDIQEKIVADTLIKNNIALYWDNTDLINTHIIKKYFNGFWNKYDVVITACNSADTILIEPDKIETNCFSFFKNKIEQESDIYPLQENHIHFLYSDDGVSSYLSELKIGASHLYIELLPKVFSKAEGYPELLLNQKEINQSIKLNKYSYAKYKKGKLVDNSGTFNYNLILEPNFNFTEDGFSTIFFENYKHTIYQSDKNTIIIISAPKKTFYNYITTFSFLFILTSLIILIFGIILNLTPFNWHIAFTDFSTKVQVFIIASIFFSFILFGWGTSYYIKKQYTIKNRKNIDEKMQSILIELSHKLGNKKILSKSDYDEMSYYLIKFSNVFYTDINLYGKEGMLLASSRPEIFDRGLISQRMNPHAFEEMSIIHKSSFIHHENIGELQYLSVYVPFRNENNKILAYLNLPYFAKQNELENELSAFYTSLINMYGLLFLITAIIAVFFANYISEPVRMIKNKISNLQIGKANEQIDWQSDDEIGALVKEYNKKVIELEDNALKLAKSERESAWREMAKQVAHEIKNPLTPMKLSVQHLQKSANENQDNIKDRINKTANTLIEQIDTLTKIANEFSNFAKMPKAHTQSLEIIPIIKASIDLYKEEISIKLSIEKKYNPLIIADKNQLTRVFNNLINNAIQAIPNSKKGKIEVIVTSNNDSCLIEIKDNGMGIEEDKQDKIFVPNFTTKSTGMGLGLAMVKNIITSINGKIWFKTELGKGTSFYIQLQHVS